MYTVKETSLNKGKKFPLLWRFIVLARPSVGLCCKILSAVSFSRGAAIVLSSVCSKRMLINCEGLLLD